jgi:hypothetical protein
MHYETLANIPDGTYEGIWSGYTIRYKFEGKDVTCQTTDGVRGVNIPVKFEVKDNLLVEESIEVLGSSSQRASK